MNKYKMSNTLIDIYNNLLKYNDTEITVIMDDKYMPWFSAKNVAIALAYDQPKLAIIKNVEEKDKTTFKNLKKFIKIIPANSQPHAIYINESGLYSLIINSKKPLAKKFKKWVFEDVLPSIRKFGSYTLEDKYKKQIKILNTKLLESNKEIKVLKNNQKKTKYDDGGMIYIVRPIGYKENLLKPGKTTKMKKRLNTYNIALADNVEVLFTMRVDDPDAVEHCIKAFMKPYIYRRNKEYYETTLEKLKDIIKKCDNILYEEFKCHKCNENIDKMSRLLNHFDKNHDIGKKELLLVKLFVDQYGGNNVENKLKQKHIEYKYLCMKQKYLILKMMVEKKNLQNGIIDIIE